MTIRACLVAGLALVAAGAPVAGSAGLTPAARQAQHPVSIDELAGRAFRAAYDLDFPDARAFARELIAAHPSASRAHRTLAAVIWLEMLFARGAVTVDTFLGGIARAQRQLPAPPAGLVGEFRRELDAAISLAEARLKAHPRDLDAIYDVGAAYALQASYTASVDGGLTSALGSARRAFNAHEKVLERDATRADAGVVVGTYRYIISGLSLPTRLFAYLAGFGGGKERGISLLETADRHRLGHPEAAVALLFIYSREARHADALALVRRLAAEYPKNRLWVLEEGAVALRADRPAEADAALTRGLALLADDPRPRFVDELALWKYKRGAARVKLGRTAEARLDLRDALDHQPGDWLRGRALLEMGRVGDLAGDRSAALGAYREAKRLCNKAEDPACASAADRLLRQPYRHGGGID